MYITSFNVFYNIFTTLRKKCLYLELFWFVFSRIWTETERYSASLRIQSQCGKIQTRITPNTNTFYAVQYFAIFHLFYNIYVFLQYEIYSPSPSIKTA